MIDNVFTSSHDTFTKYKLPLFLGACALLSFSVGYSLYLHGQESPVVISQNQASPGAALKNIAKVIKVDIEGAISYPGVYELPEGSRVKDVLVAAGGLSQKADREWFAQSINQAAKVADGSKIYIKALGENGGGLMTQLGTVSAVATRLIDVNSASAAQLDSLPGIGEQTANKIISNRPYSAIEELVSKKVLTAKVFDKIKEKISVF